MGGFYIFAQKNLMRKTFLMILTTCGILTQSQIQDNIFREKEQQEITPEMRGPGDDNDDGTLEDDDPLPVSVDDDLPLLLAAAIALILGQARKRAKSIS